VRGFKLIIRERKSKRMRLAGYAPPCDGVGGGVTNAIKISVLKLHDFGHRGLDGDNINMNVGEIWTRGGFIWIAIAL
jgi:hypothetical protein